MIWVLRGLSLLVGLFWVGVVLKSERTRKDGKWRLTRDMAGPDRTVRVSVIVPARNEVKNIGPCLDAVLAQDHTPLEVIVLDDGSTDGTSEVLDRYRDRVKVLSGGGAPLPPGWLGKPWACQRASKEASGDWLLFLDADVRLEPKAISVATGYAVREGLGMLSALGHQDMVTFWEKVLQPAVGGLILAGNDLDKQNDPERAGDRPLANGQFLFFERAAYDSIGGHEAVRSNVLDDVGLAIAAKQAGVAYRLLFARELFRVRMYDSFSAIWEGWTKNLFAGMKESWAVLGAALTFVFLTNVFPYVLLVSGFVAAVSGESIEPFLWGAGLVVTVQSARLILDRAFGQDARWSAFHVLGTSLLLVLLVHSGIKSVRGTRSWKGRSIDPAKGDPAPVEPAS